MKDEIILIPIDQIRILNPRHRDRKKFELIVQSIRNLGLKKPIQVSLRGTGEAEGPGYDLVCGQGRMEAFMALGHKEIPAIVVEVSKEERLLRSLIENMARRFASPMELISEIERLKSQNYSNVEIGRKLDINDTMVGGLLALNKAGEQRLLSEALAGSIPLTVAIEIAKTDSVETQRELLKAYESKQLNGVSIRTVKRLMDQRRLLGKKLGNTGSGIPKPKTSAASMVNAYRRESQRQRLLIQRAKLCDQKLLFMTTAFTKLFSDENFATLLRAESLFNMPKFLLNKINLNKKESV